MFNAIPYTVSRVIVLKERILPTNFDHLLPCEQTSPLRSDACTLQRKGRIKKSEIFVLDKPFYYYENCSVNDLDIMKKMERNGNGLPLSSCHEDSLNHTPSYAASTLCRNSARKVHKESVPGNSQLLTYCARTLITRVSGTSVGDCELSSAANKGGLCVAYRVRQQHCDSCCSLADSLSL